MFHKKFRVSVFLAAIFFLSSAVGPFVLTKSVRMVNSTVEGGKLNFVITSEVRGFGVLENSYSAVFEETMNGASVTEQRIDCLAPILPGRNVTMHGSIIETCPAMLVKDRKCPRLCKQRKEDFTDPVYERVLESGGLLITAFLAATVAAVAANARAPASKILCPCGNKSKVLSTLVAVPACFVAWVTGLGGAWLAFNVVYRFNGETIDLTEAVVRRCRANIGEGGWCEFGPGFYLAATAIVFCTVGLILTVIVLYLDLRVDGKEQKKKEPSSTANPLLERALAVKAAEEEAAASRATAGRAEEMGVPGAGGQKQS